MKTIQLQIDDKNYDSFMTILKTLKKDFIKSFKVENITDIQVTSDDEQKEYENILNTMSDEDKTISSKESIQI